MGTFSFETVLCASFSIEGPPPPAISVCKSCSVFSKASLQTVSKHTYDGIETTARVPHH